MTVFEILGKLMTTVFLLQILFFLLAGAFSLICGFTGGVICLAVCEVFLAVLLFRYLV